MRPEIIDKLELLEEYTSVLKDLQQHSLKKSKKTMSSGEL